MQQRPTPSITQQAPFHLHQKNTPFYHFSQGQHQDTISRVNNIFLNDNNLAGNPAMSLGHIDDSIPSAGLLPNSHHSVTSFLSLASPTSSIMLGLDFNTTEPNNVVAASSHQLVSVPGAHDSNSMNNENTDQYPHMPSAIDQEDPSGAHSSNDGFEQSGSPDPNEEYSGKKRNRLRPEQTRRLMEVFEKTPKPDSEMRKILGRQLDMTPRTVQIWFQNRRAKLKRESNTVNLMKGSVYAASGIFDSQSNRLTYTRAYMNRRPNARVASEGYTQMRNIHGFEPYPHDIVHGLPLQSPSQISIPVNLQLQSPFQSFQGTSASANSNTTPHMLGHSAMGIPAGQDHGTEALAYAAGNDSSNPAGDILSSGFLGNPSSGPAVGQPYSGSISSLSPASTMALNAQGNLSQVPMHQQQQHAYRNPQFAHNSHTRTRSFTADSHTLSNLGRGLPPSDSGGMATSQHNNAASGSSLNFQQHSMNGHGPPSLLASSDGVPTAEALLESRRRHLNDLMIINQTHAARGIRTSETATSAPFGMSTEASESDESSRPLLFSNLAGMGVQNVGVLQSPSLSTAPKSSSVAELFANIGNGSGTLATPVSSATAQSVGLTVNTNFGDISKAIMTSMRAPQPLSSSSSNGNLVNTQEDAEKAHGANNSLVEGFGGSAIDTSDTHYQFLNSLLLECNALGFLNENNSYGQNHPKSSDGASSPQLSATPNAPTSLAGSLGSSIATGSISDAQISQNSLANVLFPGSNICGSSVNEMLSASSTSFVREFSATGQSSTGSSASSESSIAMPNVGGTESFLITSASNPTSPLYSSKSIADAVALMHAPVPEPSSSQSKPSSANQVISVARNEVPGQRDLMIEQMSYPAM
ncbi:hypothetical protein EDC05_000225 [Coemansia umbellata]|nr:hypothetical protein EDC05_000225 [Coemansia umbellata]